MNLPDTLDIMKTVHQNEKDRVFALARERADNLEESARSRAAVASQDLLRIAQISRVFDAELAARAKSVYGNLQMIAEFKSKNADDDRCYCESLAHQGKSMPCTVCQRFKEES